MEKQKITDQVLQSFQTKKVITMKELISLSKSSSRNLQRYLKKWETLTSYNHNGRYYTLPGIPKFDDHGLWQFKGILFSKHGNLKKTLVALVEKSSAGLSATEIGDCLKLPAYTFLSHFKDHPSLQRQKHEGCYIYFSKQPKLFAKQREQRKKKMRQAASSDLPSDTQAVMILVDFIKHPRDTLEKLTSRLRRQGQQVALDKVRRLLTHHDLLKKSLVGRS